MNGHQACFGRWIIEQKQEMDLSSENSMENLEMYRSLKCIWNRLKGESLSWNGLREKSYQKSEINIWLRLEYIVRFPSY
uniref:Uncharacterized protein n=1 Tax=Arundo donax TaxID=35708 RepID=A0A0A9HI03_ARUDO